MLSFVSIIAVTVAALHSLIDDPIKEQFLDMLLDHLRHDLHLVSLLLRHDGVPVLEHVLLITQVSIRDNVQCLHPQ